jgi:cell wall-associated NlpC family hydrolase
VKGDTLTKLAVKFNTTRKKLETLNSLASSKITPGQVILVPSYKKSKTAKALAVSPTANIQPLHHESLRAEPVQDYDIPASTFASCPVPVPSESAADQTPATDEKPAPIAKLVSPADLEAEIAKQKAENQAQETEQPVPVTKPTATCQPGTVFATLRPTSNDARHFNVHLANMAKAAPIPVSAASPEQTLTVQTPPHKTGFWGNLFGNQSPATDWAGKFLQTARYLGAQGIEYDEDWRPPGEQHAWTMDCSNTTRYIYKATTGINLPRTASDQYYYLHLQGKAWDVPVNSQGWADGAYLRNHLQPGDLLFWENTYKPERQPPITHVMVYLGVNAQGQWLMAGSQSSRGGEHNRSNGGPDIYVFRPSQPCGGYTTWLGMVHHQGRFCAFGRPLEADPSKLAMAND